MKVTFTCIIIVLLFRFGIAHQAFKFEGESFYDSNNGCDLPDADCGVYYGHGEIEDDAEAIEGSYVHLTHWSNPPPNDDGGEQYLGPNGGNPKALFFHVITQGDALEQLDYIKRSRAGGFLFQINDGGGVLDNIINGGPAPSSQGGRYSTQEYNEIMERVEEIVDAAGDLEVFLRVNGNVDAHPGGSSNGAYIFDIFNNTEVDWIYETHTNLGKFVKASGIKGIWYDMEHYDWSNLWRPQEEDIFSWHGSKTEQQLKDRFFEVGKNAMKNLLDESPDLTVLMYPNLAYTDTNNYRYLFWFYAGMTYQCKLNGREEGVIIMSMNSYYQTYLVDWPVDFWQNTGLPAAGDYPHHYYVFQEIDQAHPTWHLWDWYWDHVTIGQSSWPILGVDDDDEIIYRWGNNDRSLLYFRNNILTMRSNNVKYYWIYDECSCWERKSYECKWPPGHITQTDLPCPGLVMQQTVPTETCQYGYPDWMALLTYVVDVPEEGDYYVWTRLRYKTTNVPGTNYYSKWSDSGYFLVVDASCPIWIGDKDSFEPGTDDDLSWRWVGHQEGDINNRAKVHIPAGKRVVSIMGIRMGLHIDRVIFTTDPDITPEDDGENIIEASTTTTSTSTSTSTSSSSGSDSTSTGSTETSGQIGGVLDTVSSGSVVTAVLPMVASLLIISVLF